jgi:hypothetical protein
MVDVKKSKSPQEFAIDFLMGGVSAAIAKTSAAPIERIKLLVQNQDEMIIKVVSPLLTRASVTLSHALIARRVSFPSGEEILPTSFVTSPPKP